MSLEEIDIKEPIVYQGEEINIYNEFVNKDIFPTVESYNEFFEDDASIEDVFEVFTDDKKETFDNDFYQFESFFELNAPEEQESDILGLNTMKSGYEWLKKNVKAIFSDDEEEDVNLLEEGRLTPTTTEEIKKLKDIDDNYLNKKKIQKTINALERLELTDTPEYNQDIETLQDFYNAYESSSDEDIPLLENAIQDIIGKYGFIVEPPNDLSITDSGIKSLTKDFETSAYNSKRYLNITSTTGNDVFRLDLEGNKNEMFNGLNKFLNQTAQNPLEPEPNSSIAVDALRAKKSRNGARYNYDTQDWSSVLMTSTEVDGKHYALPSLFPKNPNIQSSYEKDWVQFDPKTQMKEMMEYARNRGELYGFNSEEEAQDFAEGSWKNYNTVDLEKEKFFKENGIDDYSQMINGVKNYEAARDRVFFIDELTQYGNYPLRNVERDMLFGDGKIKGEKFIATKEEIELYPDLFQKDGSLRPDYKEYRKIQDDIRDNLYNLTQDEKYLQVSNEWDVESTNRRVAEMKKQRENTTFAEGTKALVNNVSIEKFGVTYDELENHIGDNELTAEDMELVNFLKRANVEAQIAKTDASYQYLNAATYLDSQVVKSAQTKLLNGLWNNVTNEWTTRRFRGEAGKVLLAMGVGGDDAKDPEFTKRILGMSRDEAAIYVADKLQKSVTESKGSSVEMMEWERSSGFREKLDVFMDNPLDMGMSLAAGSISEILPYGVQLALGTGVIEGGIEGLIAKGGARKKALAGLGGFFKGVMKGMAGTLVAMEYTNALFESMGKNNYDIMNPRDVERAMGDENVWEEGRDIGLSRGIPIAIVDYFTARMAGRLLVRGGEGAWKKAGLIALERTFADPAGEAYGEYLAQLNNQLVNNSVFSADEIALEAIGAFGNNTSNMAMNLLMTALKNERIIAGEAITDVARYSKSTFSDATTTNWAANMGNLKLLPPREVQMIQQNIGFKREAQALLGYNQGQVTSLKDLPSQTTLMELLHLKSKMEENDATKNTFGRDIATINEEIYQISILERKDDGRIMPTFNIDEDKKEVIRLEKLNVLSQKFLGKPLSFQEQRYTSQQITEAANNVEVETSPQAIDQDVSQQTTQALNQVTTQESIEESLSAEIEDFNGEILSVRQQLKQDLKTPGLTKDQKVEYRETAKEEIQSYKEDIKEAKREAKREIKEANRGDVQLSQKQIPLENVLIDYNYNKNNKGFFPNTIDNIGKLRKLVAPFGYGIGESANNTGYFLTKNNSKVSPFKNKKLKRKTISSKQEASPKTRAELVKLLSKAFPGVKVFDNIEAFEQNINQPGVVKRQTKEGYIAYGAKGDGSIYLNPDDKTLSLPIHEFGHMFVDYLKSKRSGEKGSSLYKRGLQLITSTEEGQKEYDRQVEIYGEGNKAREEALVEYIAQEGKKRAGQAQDAKAAKTGLAKWFDLLMNFVKKQFAKLKDVFASKTFAQDISGMSLEDFVNMSLRELLGGQVIDENVGVEIEKDGQMRLPSLSQKPASIPKSGNVNESVSKAREAGITDEQIREVLRVRIAKQEVNYSIEDLNTSLAVEVSDSLALPKAFSNIDGGVNLGLALFEEVNSLVQSFRGRGTTTQIRKAHIGSIRKRYPSNTENKTDAEVVKAYPINKAIIEEAPTPAQFRAFGLKTLKENSIFASLPKKQQEELIIAYDKTLETTANKDVKAEINKLRNNIAQRKQGEKSLQKIKKDLYDFVNLSFPKTNLTTTANLKAINKAIAEVTKVNYLAKAEKILSLIDNENRRLKFEVAKKISKLIKTNSTTNKTATSQSRKSSSIDVTTKEFFKEANTIIREYLKLLNPSTEEKANQFFEDTKIEVSRMINDVIDAQNKTNQTTEDRNLIAKFDAWTVLGTLPSLSLEETIQLFNELKNKSEIGRAIFGEQLEKQSKEIKRLRKEADVQVQKTNPVIFLPNGNVKNQDRLRNDRQDSFKAMKNSGLTAQIKKLGTIYGGTKLADLYKSIEGTLRNDLAMGYLLYNALDNNKGNFLKENVYYRITDAEEIMYQMYFEAYDRFGLIADNILKQKSYNNIIAEKLGIERAGKIDAYLYLKQKSIDSSNILTLPGINVQDVKGKLASNFTIGTAMRTYSLWLNDRNRKMMRADGFTDEKIEKIIKYIGPKNKQFVDEIVEYLTNEFFEGVNNVHREVYFVNMEKVLNYFPTISETIKGETGKTEIKVNPESAADNLQLFNTTAMSSRVKNTDNLRIALNFDFFDVLEAHIEDMSRWKAYIKPIRTIESILKIPSIDALLSAPVTDLSKLVNYNLNVAVDPKGKTRGPDKTKFISGGLQLATSYYLALRPMQTVKQASSFVLAFPFYTNPKLQIVPVLKKDGDFIFTPGGNVIDFSSDALKVFATVAANNINAAMEFGGFMAAAIKLLGGLKKAEILAKEISASFRMRAKEAQGGSLYLLTSGSEKVNMGDVWGGKTLEELGKSYDIVKQAFGYFTTKGDLIGVLGYLIVYNQMIENGVSKKVALRAFNDYNLTQQSRRGIDKVGMQASKQGSSKFFMAFKSAPLLMMNNFLVSFADIMRDFRDNKMSDTPTRRKFWMNGSLAAMAFTLASGIVMALFGSVDEREDLWKKMTRWWGFYGAVNGLPMAMYFISKYEAISEGRDWKKPSDVGTNPYDPIVEEIGALIYNLNKEDLNYTEFVAKSLYELVQFRMGAQAEGPEAIVRLIQEGGDYWEYELLKLLAVPESQIPEKFLRPPSMDDGGGGSVSSGSSRKANGLTRSNNTVRKRGK